MYNDTVMDHFRNPRNTGEMPDPDGIGEVGNPACGDTMRLLIKVDNGRLVDIKHQTFGCAATIACSSAASELAQGKTLNDAAALTGQQVTEALGDLPEEKIGCSNLAPDAIRAAIEDYRSKHAGTA